MPKPKSTVKDDDLFFFMDENKIENDIFTVYVQLMQKMKDWFVALSPPIRKKKDDLFQKKSPRTDTNTPIYKKCQYLQNTLLKMIDSDLQRHFEELKIEPQLYMLRWIRLLCGREFHLEDLIPIWDCIFAYDPDLQLVDYLVISMLLYIRAELLQKDYSECLKRLFKYPPVEFPFVLVERAINLSRSDSLNTTPTITTPVTKKS